MIAGSTDGIGYLLLAHVFTSHMSGNTVALMIDVASGNRHQTWRHFEPILLFFSGIVVGLTLTDVLTSAKVARMFALVAGTEAALLLAFVLLAHPAEQWMVVFPAGAMGIQNAMLRRVGHNRVRTTFVTGMITNAAQGLIEAVRAKLSGKKEAVEKLHDFYFYGSIWLLFAVGGIAGAFIEMKYGTVSLCLPLGGLLTLIAYDLVSPFAAAPLLDEEQGSAA